MIINSRLQALKDYYGDEYLHIIEFFLEQAGCYVISSECSIALAYRCNADKNPDAIDLEGTDVYVQFYSGDVKELLYVLGEGINKLAFHRHGKLRIYDMFTLRQKINRYIKD
jgi:hypothetical protein